MHHLATARAASSALGHVHFPSPLCFPALPGGAAGVWLQVRVTEEQGWPRAGPGSCRSPSQGNLASCSSPSSFPPSSSFLPQLLTGFSKPCTSHLWHGAGPSCSSGSFPKPCKSVESLSCSPDSCFPRAGPRHLSPCGGIAVSVQTRAVRTQWHSDQKAYDETRPAAITPKWSQLSSNSILWGRDCCRRT